MKSVLVLVYAADKTQDEITQLRKDMKFSWLAKGYKPTVVLVTNDNKDEKGFLTTLIQTAQTTRSGFAYFAKGWEQSEGISLLPKVCENEKLPFEDEIEN
jgi:hypothetical protein